MTDIPGWITMALAGLSVLISIVVAIRASKKVDADELQKVRETTAIEIGKLQVHVEWILKFVPKKEDKE